MLVESKILGIWGSLPLEAFLLCRQRVFPRGKIREPGNEVGLSFQTALNQLQLG